MAESVIREDETAACSGARPFYVPHGTRLLRVEIRRSITILQRFSRTTQQTMQVAEDTVERIRVA
jgi:hypothetical protein